MANPAVETALEKVRELLRPDGGDIILADGAADSNEQSNALKLQLVVENSDCPECILPVEMLEPIALDIMSADLPGLASVSIIDPRVAAENPAESAAQSAVGAKEPAAISAQSSRHV